MTPGTAKERIVLHLYEPEAEEEEEGDDDNDEGGEEEEEENLLREGPLPC